MKRLCKRGHDLDVVGRYSSRDCRQCKRDRERNRQREKYATDLEYRARINARSREDYAAGGARYQGSVRSNARRTIERLGLNLDDYPNFKLLKDQEAQGR